jgi:hypothetical protein
MSMRYPHPQNQFPDERRAGYFPSVSFSRRKIINVCGSRRKPLDVRLLSDAEPENECQIVAAQRLFFDVTRRMDPPMDPAGSRSGRPSSAAFLMVWIDVSGIRPGQHQVQLPI